MFKLQVLRCLPKAVLLNDFFRLCLYWRRCFDTPGSLLFFIAHGYYSGLFGKFVILVEHRIMFLCDSNFD